MKIKACFMIEENVYKKFIEYSSTDEDPNTACEKMLNCYNLMFPTLKPIADNINKRS